MLLEQKLVKQRWILYSRHLKKYDAEILGGLHLKMPDSIADEKVLKRSERENRKLVEHVKSKVTWAAIETKKGNPPREGLTMLNRLAGFLGQRNDTGQ